MTFSIDIRWATRLLGLLVLVFALALPATVRAEDTGGGDDTFSPEEIMDAATGFFGATSEGLADVLQKVFADLGRPNAYIAGEEVSGAFAVGLRYGRGTVTMKNGGEKPVYWQGPSIGFDFGGNAAKSFVLVYNLESIDGIFRRFPGGEGMIYFVAGVGVNYQQAGKVVLAPIRTGVGLRTGANVGYLHYTPEHSWLPF